MRLGQTTISKFPNNRNMAAEMSSPQRKQLDLADGTRSGMPTPVAADRSEILKRKAASISSYREGTDSGSESNSDSDSDASDAKVPRKISKKQTAPKASSITPNSGSTLKAKSSSKAKSAKSSTAKVQDVLKACDEQELRDLVSHIIALHPETETIISEFEPRKLPKKLSKDSAVHRTCCICLCCGDQKFHGVKICSGCNERLTEHSGVTRDKVCWMFGLSKAEADRIPRSQFFGGLRKNMLMYSYKIPTVLKAVKAKHGTLQNWVSSRVEKD
eukprot:2398946-Rhodomonas_salina.2